MGNRIRNIADAGEAARDWAAENAYHADRAFQEQRAATTAHFAEARAAHLAMANAHALRAQAARAVIGMTDPEPVRTGSASKRFLTSWLRQRDAAVLMPGDEADDLARLGSVR